MTNKTPSILIVDDNPENICVLGAALSSCAYEITVATNGEDALNVIDEELPDLILLDVMMPVMDGFEVCRRLKENPKTHTIEIIFITAVVAPNEELKGLALGAVDYIHKPYNIPIVQAKVALHLERIANKKLRDDIERITRHDFKTSLNVIMGYPQLMLSNGDLTDEQSKYLSEILRAGQDMLHMINHSLDLFKMETGRYQYDPQPMDMVLLMQQLIRDLSMLTEQYAVTVKILLDGQDYNGKQTFIALAEMNLCYSLFANLMRNAIEACHPDDCIIVAMNYENNQVVVSITNPSSVPESIRDTFFEKYVTAGKFSGTGLGTYSAKLMTETQKGNIAMTTNDQETCLTVRLPVA